MKRLRILWFTNVPLPAVNRHLGRDFRGSGGWMGALLDAAIARFGAEHDWCICCACSAKGNDIFIENGIEYRVIAQRKYFPDWEECRLLRECAATVTEWNPDVVHIHGTERFYGLLSADCRFCHFPIVISLQGVMFPCSRWENYFGNPGVGELLRMSSFFEFLTGRGLWWGWLHLRKQAQREARISRHVRYFLGRTDWDRAWAKILNPAMCYFHVGEVIQRAFEQSRWSLKECRRHQIVFTNAGHPRRGTELLIEAIALLKNDYPDIRLCLAGNLSTKKGYGRYIASKLDMLGNSVFLAGLCTAPELAELLKKSHLFVLPSLIENSPNSLCEAQLVGTPVVAADCGGISSLVEHGKTGLLFPKGDVALLAERIRQIFESDALAEMLSKNGLSVATDRHSPDRVADDLLFAYSRILDQAQG
jgi:glycosyltransferase involved in cell wall biosynthesis